MKKTKLISGILEKIHLKEKASRREIIKDSLYLLFYTPFCNHAIFCRETLKLGATPMFSRKEIA